MPAARCAKRYNRLMALTDDTARDLIERELLTLLAPLIDRLVDDRKDTRRAKDMLIRLSADLESERAKASGGGSRPKPRAARARKTAR